MPGINVSGSGAQVKRVLSANTTNSTLVQAGKTVLLGWSVSNVNAAVMYLKLYDTVAAPTVGTDTVKMTVLIPGSTAGGLSYYSLGDGIAFSSGLGLGLTTALADNSTSAVAANEIVINLYYA